MLLFIFLISVLASRVSINFTEPRKDFKYWNSIQLTKSHEGRSANQPPKEWNRVIISSNIPLDEQVQITACDENDNYGTAWRSFIYNSYQNANEIYIEFEYWDLPFNIYIGTNKSVLLKIELYGN